MPRKWTGRPRGAPIGNRNALKTGDHTREARTFRKRVRVQIAQAKALVAMVHSTPRPDKNRGTKTPERRGEVT